MRDRFSWDQQEELAAMAATSVSDQLLERTSLTPADVDTAQLYDDSASRAGSGGGARFLQVRRGGPSSRRRPDRAGWRAAAEHGRRSAVGRAVRGFGLVHEAVLQLRGQATGRQIADPKVARSATAAGPSPAPCCSLGADRIQLIVKPRHRPLTIAI